MCRVTSRDIVRPQTLQLISLDCGPDAANPQSHLNLTVGLGLGVNFLINASNAMLIFILFPFKSYVKTYQSALVPLAFVYYTESKIHLDIVVNISSMSNGKCQL